MNDDDDVLLRARGVWQEAMSQDDAFGAEARVRRLARARIAPIRRHHYLGISALALVALVLLARAWRGEPGRPGAPFEAIRDDAVARTAAPPVAPSGVADVTIGERGPARTDAPPVADVRQDPRAEWAAAQAALRGRDRTAAEAHLRALLAMPGAPVRLVDSASFSLAELELARGRTAEGASRLDRLLTSRDASLAADALFLRARAARSAQERAELYARYLAGKPPSPYREQAMVERGEALREAGDVAGARAIAVALRRERGLPGVVRQRLEGLERGL